MQIPGLQALRQRIIKFARQNSFIGFGGLPIYEVVHFVLKEIKKDNVMMRANSVAFSFFISIVPLIIVGVTLIAYIPSAQADSFLELKLIEFFPESAGTFIKQLVSELTSVKRGGALSLGFLAALFFSSNGMINMMRGFNKNYEESFKQRTGLKKRGIAILLTSLLFVLISATVIFYVLGSKIIRRAFELFDISQFQYVGLTLVKMLGVVFLFYSIISVLYKLGPAFRRKVSFFTPGATLATILSILTTMVLTFIAERFGAWNKIYGSIGSLVLVMVWFQINSLMLLIGFELNAAIVVNRDRYELVQETDVG